MYPIIEKRAPIEIIEEIRNVKVALSKQDKVLEDILLKLNKTTS